MVWPLTSSDTKKKRKHIEHAVFQVKYARRMKEDQLDEATIEKLRTYQTDLKAHLKAKQFDEGVKLADEGTRLAREIHPAPKAHYGIRENVEVFVVVIAVALAFRTYFFQPYQIPTGSMQPTLYGITAVPDYEPDWTDRFPVNIGKFLLTGSRYREVKAKTDGIVGSNWIQRDTFVLVPVGGINGVGAKIHKIHKDMAIGVRPGMGVKKGQLIARGLQKQGDHIVVNRFITNFKRPDRGDIVVFSTTGIDHVRPNSAYIKRLVGLPGDQVSICDGNLLVDGEVVTEPDVFVRQMEHPNYPGYANLDPGWFRREGEEPLFTDCDFTYSLGEDEFLMFGDNTHSSKDSRYFGAVPGDNIIGIGFFVPWPFFNRGIHNDVAGPVR